VKCKVDASLIEIEVMWVLIAAFGTMRVETRETISHGNSRWFALDLGAFVIHF